MMLRVVLTVFCLTVAGCSQTSSAPSESTELAKVVSVGGECADNSCGSSLIIQSDGTWEKIAGPSNCRQGNTIDSEPVCDHKISSGSLPEQELNDLKNEINNFNEQEIVVNSSKTCQAPVDGFDYNYTIVKSSGTVSFASCKYDLPEGETVSTHLTTLLNKAT